MTAPAACLVSCTLEQVRLDLGASPLSAIALDCRAKELARCAARLRTVPALRAALARLGRVVAVLARAVLAGEGWREWLREAVGEWVRAVEVWRAGTKEALR